MREIVSSLMAGLLFIQAVSGWCWQRPRACGLCSVPVAQVLRSCCEHDCQDAQKEPQAPCDHKLKCHGTCTYVSSEKVDFDGADPLPSLDFVAVHSATTVALSTDAVRWEIGHSSLYSKLPLPLHLYHQVLLI